jgi:hypothetical protein
MANVALKEDQKADPEIHLCHLAMANVALKADLEIHLAMGNGAPKAGLKVARKAANAQNNASSFRNMSTISTKNCATMPTPLANCTGT